MGDGATAADGARVPADATMETVQRSASEKYRKSGGGDYGMITSFIIRYFELASPQEVLEAFVR